MIKIQAHPDRIEILKPTNIVFSFSNISNFNYSSLNISFDIPPCFILRSGKTTVQFPSIRKNETISHTLTLLGKEVGMGLLDFSSFYYRDNIGKVKRPKISPIEIEIYKPNIQDKPDVFSPKMPLSQKYHAANIKSLLKDTIAKNFNIAEIRELCFDLNIPFEDIPGTTLTTLVIELIEYCNRHHQIDALVNYCLMKRPHLTLFFDE